MESNDAQELVATAAGNIEGLLANRSKALKVSATFVRPPAVSSRLAVVRCVTRPQQAAVFMGFFSPLTLFCDIRPGVSLSAGPEGAKPPSRSASPHVMTETHCGTQLQAVR